MHIFLLKTTLSRYFFVEKFVYYNIYSYFCTNRIRHASRQISEPGRVFCFMGTLRIYTKQALAISEQINLLRNRGLIIADESKAAKFLGEVSYFRFVQYLRPMEADKVTHQFKQNSRFNDAVGLYEFDCELRDLMFRAIQRIEIALRTKIIHEFSMEHGPFWFFNIALADDERKFIENMNAVDRELSRSKEYLGYAFAFPRKHAIYDINHILKNLSKSSFG